MALQTKTFSWGSYAWQSESNSYVIDLVLTENSVSSTGNTSQISYQLILRSGSQNCFTGDVDSVVKLNGVAVASGTIHVTAAYNASWVLLSGTADVGHNSDGSLNMPIEVSVNTFNSYAPPDKTLSWSWALTTVPRASAITEASNVELGKNCSVKWTPNSDSFRYKLTFAIGSWAHTTGPIHPNTTNGFIYSSYALPLEVANQITTATQGTVYVALETYSDGNATALIGREYGSFTVTVPANDSTRPTVTMSLKPAETPIAGLYIQGLSKVQGEINAQGKYDASIQSCSMNLEGTACGSPFLSGYLTTAGNVNVTAYASDSRGITGSATETITVLPYNKPKVICNAYRCNSDGVYAEDGEYLKIEASREYAPVISNGVQHNFCKVQYRYRAENATEFSKYVTILEAGAEQNSVQTEPMLNATLYKTGAYYVQVSAVDTVGQETVVTIRIPSERVFQHKRAGGKGIGFGGYCIRDDLLHVHWDERVEGDLEAVGNIAAKNFGGVYIQSTRVWGTSLFNIQTRFMQWDSGGARQTFFVFGLANHIPIYGLLTVHSQGVCTWSGTGIVSGEVADGGMVTVNLERSAYDHFTIISAQEFLIV